MGTIHDLTEGERLHIARRRSGLTVAEMASRCHISSKTVTRIEHDESGIGYWEGLAWAEACGLEPEELIPDIRSRCSSDHAGHDGTTGAA